MTRVLFVSPTGDISGGEKSLMVLLENLNRSQYLPVLLCPFEGPLVARCREASIPVVVQPLTGLTATGNPFSIAREAVSSIRFGFRFARYLRQERFNLVHVNSFRIALGCSIGARLAGIPVIWHVRDIPISAIKRHSLALLALFLSDRVIVVSRAVEEIFRVGSRQLKGVRVVYNGIDPKSVQPSRAREVVRRELGIGRDTFLVGSVGQLHPGKGQHLLLRAAALLTEQLSYVHFIIVGDRISAAYRYPTNWARYPDELRRLRQSLGLTDIVSFLGLREDVPDLLGAMDVYAHTATWPDPLPRSVLEAMAAGVPLVCSAVGGVGELVKADESALIFSPGDPNALAQAILSLARDPQRRASLSEAAARRVENMFSVHAHVQGVESVYREVTSSVPSGW